METKWTKWYAMTSHVIAYRSLELLFPTHTFHFNCFFDYFNCVFTQIRCLSRVLLRHYNCCLLRHLIKSTLGSLSFKQYGPRSDRAVCKGLIFFAFTLEVVWIALKYNRLLSLYHTEHRAYTACHPCKPYIQPNEPLPYPSYTRAIPVYP